MSDVTHLLDAAAAGDIQADHHLLPLVYEELRKLASARMVGESPDHTLQPTELVHEAYVRLVGTAQPQHWNSRGHFFAAAAEAMRRILIEHARHKQSLKAGGGWERLPMLDTELAVNSGSEELFAVDEAITRLSQQHPRAAQLIHLRFFLGMTLEEAATQRKKHALAV